MKLGLLVRLEKEDIAVIGGVFKIGEFRSYSRNHPNDPELPRFYCELLRELIKNVIKAGDPSEKLRDFLETLDEGIFCPAALRLHSFLNN